MAGLSSDRTSAARGAAAVEQPAVREPRRTDRSAAGLARRHGQRRRLAAHEPRQLALERGDRALPTVVALGVCPRRVPQPRDGGRLVLQSLEELDEALPHRLRRGGVEHEPRIERVEQLGRGADRRAEHRGAAREGLDGHEPEALQLARGQHEAIGGLVVEGQVGVRHEAEEAHVLGDAERSGERLEVGAPRARAGDEELGIPQARYHERHGAQQRVESHA